MDGGRAVACSLAHRVRPPTRAEHDPDHERHDQGGEARPDEVVHRRPQPTWRRRTRRARHRRGQAGSRCSRRWPRTSADVVERPGDRQARGPRRGPRSASPRPARAAMRRVHRARTSPSGRPGVTRGPAARTRRGRDGGPGRAWPLLLGGRVGRRPRSPARRRGSHRLVAGRRVEGDHDARRRRAPGALASGLTQVGSSDEVMTTAVMPRRSRPDAWRRASRRAASLPSASTAARSCMILRCWRPPRSAGRSAVRAGVDGHARRPGSRPSALSAIDGRDPDGRLDGRLVAASAAWTPRWRSRKIQASAVCSRSNSLTWISPWRAVDFQWIRLKLSPGAHGRTVVASGVVWSVRSGEAWLPSRLAAGRRHERERLEPRVDDDRDALADRRRRLEEAERVAGPDVQRLDPEVAAPRQRRPDEPRPLAPRPRVIARPGRPPGSVVGLWTSSQGFGSRLALRSV